ncbi:MAG: polymer-forming cytoskeletal protein [Bacteroidetes bacterium]|nr:polymer-forming cytoskeletal protein [Bacteroidota bacterium]
MTKNNVSDSSSVNLLGSGTTIEGDIKSSGDIRIDGTLIGSLTTKGKLVIGATGTIEGEIICQNADISGTIKGKITVNELLSLKATTKLTGDIVTNKLAIEPGANFSGSCSMGAVIKDIKQGERDGKKQEKAAAF